MTLHIADVKLVIDHRQLYRLVFSSRDLVIHGLNLGLILHDCHPSDMYMGLDETSREALNRYFPYGDVGAGVAEIKFRAG